MARQAFPECGWRRIEPVKQEPTEAELLMAEDVQGELHAATAAAEAAAEFYDACRVKLDRAKEHMTKLKKPTELYVRGEDYTSKRKPYPDSVRPLVLPVCARSASGRLVRSIHLEEHLSASERANI